MNSEELLRRNNLSNTGPRVKLLSVLADSGYAMSEKEIEVKMNGSCNKTTIYRNLTSLVKKKIVHRIISGEAVRFKLMFNGNDHVHFQCRKCNVIYCLDDIPVQEYKLPEGFKMMEKNFLISGICKRCL